MSPETYMPDSIRATLEAQASAVMEEQRVKAKQESLADTVAGVLDYTAVRAFEGVAPQVNNLLSLPAYLTELGAVVHDSVQECASPVALCRMNDYS